MEILSKWRTFNVSVVGGLKEPYVIDEAARRILIRRSWLRPWRMLDALAAAMNAITARRTFNVIDTVKIANETWKLVECNVPASIFGNGEVANLDPCRMDYEKNEIYLSAWADIAAVSGAIAKLVNNVYADKELELAEKMEELIESFRATWRATPV